MASPTSRIAQRGVDLAHAQRHGDVLNALDGEVDLERQRAVRLEHRFDLPDRRRHTGKAVGQSR
jgi:hypothetical protein